MGAVADAWIINESIYGKYSSGPGEKRALMDGSILTSGNVLVVLLCPVWFQDVAAAAADNAPGKDRNVDYTRKLTTGNG